MVGRVTPTILAMDAFETCFAGGWRTLGAGRNAQISRRCQAVAREGQKRVLFYAFVTLYRDHFIDGMRNVMTFLFVCRAVAGKRSGRGALRGSLCWADGP